MPTHKFEDLLSQIQDCLTKEDTMMRPSIRASERLAVTLRFLASGETFSSLEKPNLGLAEQPSPISLLKEVTRKF